VDFEDTLGNRLEERSGLPSSTSAFRATARSRGLSTDRVHRGLQTALRRLRVTSNDIEDLYVY